MERSPTNQAFVTYRSLIGRYLQGRLDADWSTLAHFVDILFADDNVRKPGIRGKKDNIAGSSVFVYGLNLDCGLFSKDVSIEYMPVTLTLIRLTKKKDNALEHSGVVSLP